MAEIVRWFKSGEVKLTQFSQPQSDDTEDGRDQETESDVPVHNKGKPQHTFVGL